MRTDATMKKNPKNNAPAKAPAKSKVPHDVKDLALAP